MHLLLLLESPFGLQDWVLKLGPSIYMAEEIKKEKEGQQRLLDFTPPCRNPAALSTLRLRSKEIPALAAAIAQMIN